ERGNVNEIGILRMNANARDLTRVFETDPFPRFSAIGRLVNAIAVRHVAANRRLAHTDIDHVRIRIGNGDRADRAGAEHGVITDGFPVDAAVRRFPHTATGRAVVVNEWLRSYAGHCRRAPTAIWTNAAILQRLE